MLCRVHTALCFFYVTKEEVRVKRDERYTREYTLEDFDCRYCLYYDNSTRPGGCLAEECVCLDDFYKVVNRDIRKEIHEEVIASVGQLGNTEPTELP